MKETMEPMTTTKIATLGIAFILCGGGALAMSNPSAAQVRTIAQTTPEPSPTPTSAHTDQNGVNATPAPTATGIDQAPAVNAGGQPSMPAATSAPVSNPTPSTDTTMPATTTPSSGTVDLKKGGLSGNSNGDNWIDKFNRNPGSDTHPGAATTIKVKAKVKVKKTPPKGM
ncbi:MAG: hypothetical protein GIW97_01550 [Candidatus Eremiobacteraeota bacterium]|nr:hypothetical protein [Candidatus Eremiobacteraeota bacterium]